MKRHFILLALILSVMTAPVFAQPDEAAPIPDQPDAEVTSLFSDYYADATVVDTWSADWDNADVQDYDIQGDNTKLYTNLVFAGIEFVSQPLDVEIREFFHMDIWTPEPTDLPAVFRIKLVDFGADGLYGGGDDSEHELAFNADDGLTTGNWVSFDIPMADFVGLANATSMAQIVISGDLPTVYVDNIFWYGIDEGEDPVPAEAAPAPTEPADEVISLFSNAYDDVLVDTWSAVWDMATVEDVQIAGDDVKLYTGLVFAGIEFLSQPLDVSDMGYFHMDIWTPNSTDLPAVFKIKLVDFGPDGQYDGGDDSEHELTFDRNSVPSLQSEQWISFAIPMSDFENLTNLTSMAQMVLSGDLPTVYVDNVYFSEQFTNVPEQEVTVPTDYAVVSVYPNPFNPATTVQLTLPYTANVEVSVYNSLGRQVAELAAGRLNAGTHALPFDGSSLSSGMYLLRATVDGAPLTSQKLMLLK